LLISLFVNWLISFFEPYQEAGFCLWAFAFMLQFSADWQIGALKKPIRKSDELLIFFVEVFKAVDLTYLSR
jgi:hypothetical protein